MTAIRPRDHIQKTKPYVPGGKLAFDGQIALMASNENPLGPSPKAVEAMRAAAGGVHIYPDPNYTDLRNAIATAQGISDASRIVVSSGSDEIIHLLTQAYAGPGDEVLFTEHAFSMYRVSALGHGAHPVAVPETSLRAGMNAILGGVSDRTRLVFIANPNNPTGTMMPMPELEALQDALPPHVMLVLDGAYAEYLGPDYEAALRDLVDRRETTVMMRTFSKIHGLAALRLGWGYFPVAIAETLQRVRGPFNVNAMAVAAGIASIGDEAYLTLSRETNNRERETLRADLQALGLETPEAHANFLIPDFGSADRAYEANAFLKARGILVRSLGGYGLPSRLRITIGAPDTNARLMAALKAFTGIR